MKEAFDQVLSNVVSILHRNSKLKAFGLNWENGLNAFLKVKPDKNISYLAWLRLSADQLLVAFKLNQNKKQS